MSRVNPVFWVFRTASGKLFPVRRASLRYDIVNQMKPGTSEDELLRRIEAPFPRPRGGGVGLSIGDDAALWRGKPGFQTILTCDWFLEGMHFLRELHPPASVGWKCLVRAVSDVAAMGGVPRCFLLGLALPPEETGVWLRGFLRGLGRAADRFDCPLVGGDTTRQDRILISVAVVGEIRAGKAVLRSGALPGDRLYVSGRLGEAELGWRELQRQGGPGRPTSRALRKHLYPQPRLALGQWLRGNRLATAMMDLSDGLSTDLPRLCAASRVGATIDLSLLPLVRSDATEEAIARALHGGDDYELLFTVKPSVERRLPVRYRGVPLTRIGLISKGRKIVSVTARGKINPICSGGWDPFRS